MPNTTVRAAAEGMPKIGRRAVRAKHRKALSAFVERCLDPLPTAVLIDTHYNSLMRMARKGAWRKAEIRVEYTRAAVDFYLAEGSWQSVIKRNKKQAERASSDRLKALDLLRAARAELALTPAPDAAAVAWKRKLDVTYLPITAGQVARAISEDEAFLAAHPTRVRKGGAA